MREREREHAHKISTKLKMYALEAQTTLVAMV